MATLKKRRKKIPDQRQKNVYRRGGVGCVKWIEENVMIPVYHKGSDIPTWTSVSDLPKEKDSETGRSYYDMWQFQRKELKRALRMVGGRFIYRLLIFCWPRGEGKSFFACLIMLWKFFNWPRQQIMLGANSKDQVKFVHFDIMRDIILNSPTLLRIVGKKNIQEKEIRIKDRNGNIVSFIRSISSFSGIVSNITGYTFSEMFDMKNPKFFVQLDGSIRNQPNAFGVIDSTVSEKSHILHRLYESFIQDKDPKLFFSYRYSNEGDYRDYWHPGMSKGQLESYRNKFPKAEFERYFLNKWSAGAVRLFTEDMIEATNFIGVDNSVAYTEISKLLQEKIKARETTEDMINKGIENPIEMTDKIQLIERRLVPLPYTLEDRYGFPAMATSDDLDKLTKIYNTDWAIGIGLDRADPMKSRTRARTILTVIAKGLPGSKSNPEVFLQEGVVRHYIYCLLHLVHIETSDLEDIKMQVRNVSTEFDGVDSFCSERWGVWDLEKWLAEQGIVLEALSPTYDRQRDCFSELYTLYRTCRFKAPPVIVPGSKKDDILKEETEIFDHDAYKKWYGSPEKDEKYGVQDDAVYSVGWGIYGLRTLSLEDFRERKGMVSFGELKNTESLIADY